MMIKNIIKKTIALLMILTIFLSNTTVLAENMITENRTEETVEETIEKEEEEKEETKEEASQEVEEEIIIKEDEKEIEENTSINNEKVEEPIEKVQEITKSVENKMVATIPDGIYTITTALDNNQVVEVTDGKTGNGANVAIGKNRNIFQQQFKFQYNRNKNTYTITARHSNKVLDVAGGESKNGTNIQQYTSNGTVAQQWVLQEAGNGYYYIVSKGNGLCLDVAGGVAKNGTNIQLYKENGTKSQKFKIEKASELACEKIKEEGMYTITTALSSSKAIQVENGKNNNTANIELANKTKTEHQKFNLKYNEKLKSYTIAAVHSNKVLDVAGGESRNGTNVQQYAGNGSIAQQWILQEAGNGYYYIVSKGNGLYLDVAGGNAKNGANIQVYEGNKTKSQKFKLEATSVEKSDYSLANGTYYIQTRINSNKRIKADMDSNKLKLANNLDVINPRQRFEIQYLDNGYYSIKVEKTNEYLTVENGNYNNGTSIKQAGKDNSTRQEWIIKDLNNGYYAIISRYSKLYIDIPGGEATTGKLLQMYTGNETQSQQFKFEKAEEIEGKQCLQDGVYRINTALNVNKGLDIAGGSYYDKGNLQIWAKDKVQQQKFQITYHKEGKYYDIKLVHSGKVLDVAGGERKNGANVQQYTSNDSVAQQWILQEAGNGYYYVVSKASLLYLDIANGNAQNGANVQLYEGNGSTAQKFKFQKVPMIDNDVYHIAIRKNANQYLDIEGGNRQEGAKLQIWQNNSVNQQVFRVEYIDSNCCKITAKHSNMALTIQGNSVVQKPYENLATQQWSIEIVGSGYYRIKSRATGEYMEIVGNKTANGTKIQTSSTIKNNESQKFSFNTLTQKVGIDVSEFNGAIDWAAVRASGQADFAMIRVGYRGYGSGKMVTDMQFVKNVTGAQVNGINIGLYFFTQAITVQEAREEANYVLDLVRKYHIPVNYPIVIDTEYSGSPNYAGRADGLDVATRTAICNAFVETIEKAGYIGATYASRNWFYEKLDVSQLTRGDIWVAHYTSAGQTDYQYRYHIWQYTSSGSVYGIKGRVDMNIAYKKY